MITGSYIYSLLESSFLIYLIVRALVQIQMRKQFALQWESGKISENISENSVQKYEFFESKGKELCVSMNNVQRQHILGNRQVLAKQGLGRCQ